MPGSVQNAAPATVLPQSLCRAFAHERAYPMIENAYKNGESQRSVLATASRKRWRIPADDAMLALGDGPLHSAKAAPEPIMKLLQFNDNCSFRLVCRATSEWPNRLLKKGISMPESTQCLAPSNVESTVCGCW